MPKNFTLVPEMFEPGHYEVPVFLADGSKVELAGVGIVTVRDLDLEAEINLDDKILKKMGYSCVFIEENDPLEKSTKYKLVIRRDNLVRIPLVQWTGGKRQVLGVAEITGPLNESEREWISNSELIAECFDVPYDDEGKPIHPEEGDLLEPFKLNPLELKDRKATHG